MMLMLIEKLLPTTYRQINDEIIIMRVILRLVQVHWRVATVAATYFRVCHYKFNREITRSICYMSYKDNKSTNSILERSGDYEYSRASQRNHDREARERHRNWNNTKNSHTAMRREIRHGNDT